MSMVVQRRVRIQLLQASVALSSMDVGDDSETRAAHQESAKELVDLWKHQVAAENKVPGAPDHRSHRTCAAWTPLTARGLV